MKYELKSIVDPKTVAKSSTSEAVLKDLLSVLPTLRKYKLEGELQTKIRQLRNGRKSTEYVLELTRHHPHVVQEGEVYKLIKEIKASSKIVHGKKSAPDRMSARMETIKNLKEEICNQIKEIRKTAKPVIDNYNVGHGITVKKFADVYVEKDTFIKVFNRKIRNDMLGNSKKPTTKDNYVGIELEFACNNNAEYLADRFFEAGLAKFVSIGRDGSVQATTEFPNQIEIRILVRQGEYKAVVEKVCEVINNTCKIKIGKDCGLHVHLDMRQRSKEKAFSNLVLSQQFLYAMLPANRRSSEYSYPVKGAQWRVLNNRYHGINNTAISKYGTIELRMHSGTSQAEKINRWIELLLYIVDAPAMAEAATRVDAFQTAIGGSDDLMAYVKSRIKKFAKQHASTVPSKEEPGTMPNIEEVVDGADDTTQTELSEAA